MENVRFRFIENVLLLFWKVSNNKNTIMYLTMMKARPPATRRTNNDPPTAATITIHGSVLRKYHVIAPSNNII